MAVNNNTRASPQRENLKEGTLVGTDIQIELHIRTELQTEIKIEMNHVATLNMPTQLKIAGYATAFEYTLLPQDWLNTY